MATIVYTWSGDGIAKLQAALGKLSGASKNVALARALNHTGRKASTQVKRALADQMGLPQGRFLGRIVDKPAFGGKLAYAITTRGKAFRAKEFGASQGAGGVTFHPWGRTHYIAHAFVINRYDGNFFRRRGAARFPIEALLGPNINKEVVKDLSAAAFERVVAADLPARVAHEVTVLTSGVVS